MGIASFSGASSVIKPGVVTSSTRPSSPFVGQLIYETDTARLAAYNGSAWVTQNGLQLVKTQTIGTAVSSVTVSDAFSSTYDNYKVLIIGGVSSGGADVNLQLGSTTTGYYRSSIYGTFAGGAATNDSVSNGSSFTSVGFGNTGSLHVDFELISPNLAKSTVIKIAWIRAETGGRAGFSGGFVDNTTQYTAFTLTNNFAATFTGGTICVYGYAKA